MIVDFITIARDQSAATEAAELLQFIRDMRSVYERAIRIRDKMKHNFNDSNPDAIVWTALETKWGVPTDKGVDVFTFLDGVVLAMTNGQQNQACKDITEQVG